MSSENTLSFESLIEEFNLPPAEPNTQISMPPKQTEEEIKQEADKLGSIEDITKKNIVQLNNAIEFAQRELQVGNTSPKMFEALSKLADAVTNATQVLATQQLTTMSIEQKERGYNLREWEIRERLKLRQEGKDSGPQINVNAIVTDRESLLDAIIEGINKREPVASNLSENLVTLEQEVTT